MVVPMGTQAVSLSANVVDNTAIIVSTAKETDGSFREDF